MKAIEGCNLERILVYLLLNSYDADISRDAGEAVLNSDAVCKNRKMRVTSRVAGEQ